MTIRTENLVSEAALQFLKGCYRFVTSEWQHADRDGSPDQGFERQFRESCVRGLTGWTVSQCREMQLDGAFETASGVLHEVDIVACHSNLMAVAELKNKSAFPPDKNDVIVFFAKLLDYLARHPSLLHKEVVPVFLSTGPFETTGLTACIGLGIHPITPGLRPFPVIVDSGLAIEKELANGVVLAEKVRQQFDDFCARVNRTGVALADSWVSSRCGYQSDDRIVVKAVPSYDAPMLNGVLRQLNSDCMSLLTEVRAAKARAET